jgi:DNA processing protein
VVSGLASGIDGAAHLGALDSGAVTVAVMGGGHRHLYPARHRALAARIAQHRGAVVSEYPAATQPRPAHFPERNRIISGLSGGVVVVEATVRSGSLITARMGLEQGREVMAVPGSVLGPGHGGCHRLLKDGAMLVEGALDVLAAFGVQPVAADVVPPSDAVAMRVLRAMPQQSIALQWLVERTRLPVTVLLGALVQLELDGFVEAVADG